MGREQNREAKRERIIMAAVRVFAERGYQAGKMEDIAAEAGIAKGTVYEYFNSKLELLQEIMQITIEKYLGRFGDIETTQMSLQEWLHFIITVHHSYAMEHQYLIRILCRDIPWYDPVVEEWFIKIDDMRSAVVERKIEQAIERGELRPVKVTIAAQILILAMESAWKSYVLREAAPLPRVEDMQMAVDMIFEGIKAS